MMKEAYGDARYDKFQAWTFRRLAEAFTFQFLWSTRGSEHDRDMLTLLSSMDAAGFHALWTDAHQPFAQALVNVQRYLDHQIVTAILAEDPRLGTRWDEGFRYRGLWKQANTLLEHVPEKARASISDLETRRSDVRSFLARAQRNQSGFTEQPGPR